MRWKMGAHEPVRNKREHRRKRKPPPRYGTPWPANGLPLEEKRKKKLCQYYKKKSTPANRYPIVDIYKKGSGSQIEKEREFVCGKHKKTVRNVACFSPSPDDFTGGV